MHSLEIITVQAKIRTESLFSNVERSGRMSDSSVTRIYYIDSFILISLNPFPYLCSRLFIFNTYLSTFLSIPSFITLFHNCYPAVDQHNK
jgi:hypothetical protein